MNLILYRSTEFNSFGMFLFQQPPNGQEKVNIMDKNSTDFILHEIINILTG